MIRIPWLDGIRGRDSTGRKELRPVEPCVLQFEGMAYGGARCRVDSLDGDGIQGDRGTEGVPVVPKRPCDGLEIFLCHFYSLLIGWQLPRLTIRALWSSRGPGRLGTIVPLLDGPVKGFSLLFSMPRV